jgi:hypothetical protein
MEKTSRSIAKGALGEFNSSMQILFDNQINPLITDIDFVLSKNIRELDQSMKERISQTEFVIIKSIKAFEGATEKTIIGIRDKIIREAANEIREIEQQVFDDIMIVFEQAMDLIDAVDCTQDKWLEDIDWLMSFGDKFLWRLDDCFTDLGIKKFPERFEYRTWYQIHSCKVIKTLDENTPIERILSVYHDLSGRAKRTACIQRSTGDEMNEYFVRQWKSYQFRYRIWNNIQNQ